MSTIHNVSHRRESRESETSSVVPAGHVLRLCEVYTALAASDFHYSDGDTITLWRTESTSGLRYSPVAQMLSSAMVLSSVIHILSLIQVVNSHRPRWSSWNTEVSTTEKELVILLPGRGRTPHNLHPSGARQCLWHCCLNYSHWQHQHWRFIVYFGIQFQ